MAQPTFGELYLASLAVIRFTGWRLIFLVPFPLAGLFLLSTPLMGYRLGPIEIAGGILGLAFTPLMSALGVWSRRRNKLSRGPFTYTFDAEGLTLNGPLIDQKIRWQAIPRIRVTKSFLLVFISPVLAYCIPRRAIADPADLARIRDIASIQTDWR